MSQGGSKLVVFCGLVLAWAGMGTRLVAQDPPSSPPTSVPQVRALPFPVYLKRNEDGELVLVPDFSLEEYLRLYDKAVGGEAPEPKGYVIRELEVRGEVLQEEARLKVRVVIERPAREDKAEAPQRWLSVPLRLGRAAMVESPRFQGEGRKFVTYDLQRRSYLLWFTSPPGSRHEVECTVVVPVVPSDAGGKLAVALPEAVVSRWHVDVVGQLAEVTLEGGTGGVLSLGTYRDGKTQTHGEGLRGDTRIVWKRVDQSKVTRAGIDVDGTIRIDISGPRQVTTEAHFAVRPVDGELSEVELRLPPGMAFRPAPDAFFEYAIRERNGEKGHLVAVRPRGDRPPEGEWQLRLTCEWAGEDNDPGTARWQPAHFEITGAVRHRGEIHCTVHGQWSVVPKVGPRVVRIPDRPLSFRYYAQPPELTLTVRRRLARGRVQPDHRVRVFRDRLELHSRLHYRFAGIPPARLPIRGGDWELIDVQMDGEPLPEAPQIGTGGQTEIILPADRGSGNGIELELTWKKPINQAQREGRDPIVFVVPRPDPPPEGTIFVAPGELQVETATDVQVVPLAAELRGLTLDATRARGEAEPSIEVIRLREQGGGEMGQFAGMLLVHDRQVEVEEEVAVSGQGTRLEWTQFLSYHVRYQPGIRLRLVVPPSLVDDDLARLECMVWQEAEGRPSWGSGEARLEITPLAVPAEGWPEGWRLIEIVLPRVALGRFVIGLRRELPAPQNLDRSWTWDVPWCVPLEVDGTPVQRRGALLAVEMNGRSCSVVPAERWEPVSTGEELQQFETPLPVVEGHVTLQFASAASGDVADVGIEREWVQTWLTQTRRRDRVVWRMMSQRRELQVALPAGIDPKKADVHWLIDGESRSAPHWQSGRVWNVPLRPEDLGRPLVVEVWYSFPGRPPIGRLELTCAQLVGAHAPTRTYWQVVTPLSEHLWKVGGDWAAEVRWERWGELLWRRAWPSQPTLESWAGGSHQAPLPPTVHAYTFSSLGAPQKLPLVTVRRAWLVGGASGVVLLMGWLLASVPWMRHPRTLAVLGIALIAVALLVPLIAFELAQAALVGLAACWLAWAIDWMVRRPQVRRPGGVALEPPSGQSRVAPIESPGTTLTAPAVPRESSVESLG